MDDLQWTDDPPEKEGWYWIDDGSEPPFAPRIVKVGPYHRQPDIDLVVDDPMDDAGIQRTLDEYADTKWAGPIPEPNSTQPNE